MADEEDLSPGAEVSGGVVTTKDRRLLFVTRLFLVVILVPPWIVGPGSFTWPVMGWAMYSLRVVSPPGDSRSAYEIRAIDDGGTVHRLRVDEIQHFDRRQILNRVIKALRDPSLNEYDRKADSLYLWTRVRAALSGVRVIGIEIWKVTWKVEPTALPPLDREHPIDERLIVVVEPVDDSVPDREGAVR